MSTLERETACKIDELPGAPAAKGASYSQTPVLFIPGGGKSPVN